MSFYVNVSTTRISVTRGQGMCASSPWSSGSSPKQILLCMEWTNDSSRNIRVNQWRHHWLIWWMTVFPGIRMEENFSPLSCFPNSIYFRTFIISTVSYSLLFFLCLLLTFTSPLPPIIKAPNWKISERDEHCMGC